MCSLSLPLGRTDIWTWSNVALPFTRGSKFYYRSLSLLDCAQNADEKWWKLDCKRDISSFLIPLLPMSACFAAIGLGIWNRNRKGLSTNWGAQIASFAIAQNDKTWRKSWHQYIAGGLSLSHHLPGNLCSRCEGLNFLYQEDLDWKEPSNPSSGKSTSSQLSIEKRLYKIKAVMSHVQKVAWEEGIQNNRNELCQIIPRVKNALVTFTAHCSFEAFWEGYPRRVWNLDYRTHCTLRPCVQMMVKIEKSITQLLRSSIISTLQILALKFFPLCGWKRLDIAVMVMERMRGAQ